MIRTTTPGVEGRQATALGADAIVDLDDETVGSGGMLRVSASGTAVRLG
jgi:uncharacterized protein YbjQ (UPF0145 family)